MCLDAKLLFYFTVKFSLKGLFGLLTGEDSKVWRKSVTVYPVPYAERKYWKIKTCDCMYGIAWSTAAIYSESRQSQRIQRSSS